VLHKPASRNLPVAMAKPDEAIKDAIDKAIEDDKAPSDAARCVGKVAKDAGASSSDAVEAAGHAAAEVAALKHYMRDKLVLEVTDAAIEMAVAESDSLGQADAGQSVAAAVLAVGGTQLDASKASAAAAVCAKIKKGRQQLTDELFKSWDADGNGTIEFEEVVPHYLAASNNSGQAEEEVRKAFAYFMRRHGLSKTDAMTRDIFGAWMGRATLVQLAFQYVRALGERKSGHTNAEIAKTAKDASETAGGCGKEASEAVMQALGPSEPSKSTKARVALAAKDPKHRKQCSAAAVAEHERKGQQLEEKYGKLFDEIDSTKTGVLSSADMQAFVHKMSPVARAELGIGSWRDFMKDADVDGDGKVDRLEFIVYFTHMNLDKEKCYAALFEDIDADGNGEASMEQVRNYEWHRNVKLFEMLGVSNWHAMVAKMDTNQDGQISREEFVTHMTERFVNEIDKTLGKKRQAKPAWKQARGLADAIGKRKKSDGGDHAHRRCWDFEAGYCSRGARCHYVHLEAHAPAIVDEHWKFVLRETHSKGLRISEQAMHELQTLNERDAKTLIDSVSIGGEHEDEFDKSHFILQSVRRTRMQAHHDSPKRLRSN